jgi:hypothetical protein
MPCITACEVTYSVGLINQGRVVVGYVNVGEAPKEIYHTTSMKIDHKFFVFDCWRTANEKYLLSYISYFMKVGSWGVGKKR